MDKNSTELQELAKIAEIKCDKKNKNAYKCEHTDKRVYSKGFCESCYFA